MKTEKCKSKNEKGEEQKVKKEKRKEQDLHLWKKLRIFKEDLEKKVQNARKRYRSRQ